MLWVTMTTVNSRASWLDELLNLQRGDGVQGGTGLVHQQHVWQGGDGAGDAEALLLAA